MESNVTKDEAWESMLNSIEMYRGYKISEELRKWRPVDPEISSMKRIRIILEEYQKERESSKK